MNSSLALTFDYLATTPNAAAIDALAETFRAAGPRSRRLSVESLAHRGSDAAMETLLNMWGSLTDVEKQAAGAGRHFGAFVAKVIAEEANPLWDAALQAAEQLSLYEVLPELIRSAESSVEPRVRQASLFAVLSMAGSLGAAARRDMDRPSVRRPVLERLAGSVRAIQFHCGEALVDAFLSVALWSDPVLQGMLDENSPAAEILLDRLQHSGNPQVIDLLAGWISKRRIPGSVWPILRSRDDQPFGTALLRQVGPVPGGRTLRNLKQLRSAAALESAAGRLRTLNREFHAGLIHSLQQLDTDRQTVREVAVGLIEAGDAGAVRAAAKVLHRTGPLPMEILLPEAAQLAEALGDGAGAVSVDNSLLWRQIQLLHYPCEQVQSAVLLSLTHLTAKAFFAQQPPVRFADVSRIAVVLRFIDADVDQFVINALHHPLVERRIEAVEAAAALGLIDSLVETLRRVYARDHLEVRIRIAESLHYGVQDDTKAWLNELKDAKAGPIRDAARQVSKLIRETF